VAGIVLPLLEFPAVKLAPDSIQHRAAQQTSDQDVMISLEALLKDRQVVSGRR
jgi:hypothetical protein